MRVKVTQSCLTLCDPMDYAVHGILQARILKWVPTGVGRCSLLQGIFPAHGSSVDPRSPTLQADSLPAEPQGKPKWLLNMERFSASLVTRQMQNNIIL